MRLFAIILMFTVLLLVSGSLLSIPFIVRDPLPAIRPPGSAVIEERDGRLASTLELQVETGGRFALVLTTNEQRHEKAGNLSLRMLDHEMPPLTPALQTNSNHEYKAVGWFPMPGRWEVSLKKGDQTHFFQFILRE